MGARSDLALWRADDNGCWIWQARITSAGYGVLGLGARGRGNVPAHRAVYETLVGPVPTELHLDHLCRVKACVNPDHLEPVTSQVNTLRGVGTSAQNKRKTHCVQGHELKDENLWVHPTKGHRRCVTCHREALRKYRERRRAEAQ